MNQDILLSKIVPNSTETTWAQAYTTLNVYMTLSIEREGVKTPVTSYGKDILEKLQREFFALDNKSLEEIKKAVSNVTASIEKDYRYSIIIGAIVKNILYIVTASKGKVIIKRGDKIGTIAEGEENELIGYSGELKHNDIVVFETGDFAEKIDEKTLQEYFQSPDITQIAENITPLIHDGSKGTEAAIIIQYKDLSNSATSNDTEQDELVADTEIKDEEIEKSKTTEPDTTDDQDLKENLWTKPPQEENNSIEELDDNTELEKAASTGKKFPFIPNFNFANRKKVIGIIVAILIIILIGAIAFQVLNQSSAERKAQFEEIYNPSKTAMENASTVEELENILTDINTSISKFPENTDEHKSLLELKTQIEARIEEIKEESSAKNLSEVIKAGNELSSIDLVTFKGADILVASQNDKKVAIIEDGKISDEFEVDDSIKYLSSDNRFIYTLGSDGITQIDIGNGTSKIVVQNADGLAFDVFSSNLYVLQSDDIRRYRSPSFSNASYFTEEIDFSSTPISMSINGSIFVLEKGGNIESFNRGSKEDFEVSSVPFQISDSSMIYTDGEYENIYIMDNKNQRVVSLSSTGEYKKEYSGSFINNAKSFAIDEENSKGYVVSNNTLYSFDL